MTSFTPLGWIHPNRQLRTLLVLTLGTFAIWAVLSWQGGSLKTAHAPLGIVSFEFIGTTPATRELFADWGIPGQMTARWNLVLDALFIPFYAATLSLGATIVAQSWMPALGVLLAWLMPIAAVLDYAENYALWRLLAGDFQPHWPPVAAWCAGAKFCLVGVTALLYVLPGLVLVWRRRGALTSIAR